MHLKNLAMAACAAALLSGSQACSQSWAQGAQARRVAAPDATHLVYEYQTGAGPARVRIDPATLVNDIDRARKRIATKQQPVKTAAAPPAPETVQRPAVTQAVEPAPVLQAAGQARKVRIIPLYNRPSLD